MNIDPEKLKEGYKKIIGEINLPHLDLKKVAPKILDVIVDVFGADRADLAIIREDFDINHMALTEENAIKLRITKGYKDEDWRMLVESGVLMESIRHAIVTKKSQIYSDTSEESPKKLEISEKLEHGCWMNHVLVIQDRAIANVHLASKERFYYQIDELKELEHMSQLLATAINVAGLWEKERMLLMEFIHSLNAALEVRDKYTAGHVERVKLYAGLIAQELKLPDDQVELIKTAAILHDIGKIGVSDSVLKKPGALNDEERKEIQQHVVMTDVILKNLSHLDEARHLACFHHETYNGTGYVMGVSGEDIPLGSRIISIADTFDAMTSNRAYRRAFFVEEALNIMEDPSIKQWDKSIIKIFTMFLRTNTFRSIAEKEGLIIYKNGKYDRENSSLKFEQFTNFFKKN